LWTFVMSACTSACRASTGALVNACHYSFADLYRAAQLAATPRVSPTESETKAALARLYAQPRELINAEVEAWAATAGWCTEEQRGSDGGTYIAFAPPAPVACEVGAAPLEAAALAALDT